jgi:hypothetical protein
MSKLCNVLQKEVNTMLNEQFLKAKGSALTKALENLN